MPRTTAGDYGDLVGRVRGGVNDAIRLIEGKMRVPGYEGVEHMHDDAIGAREEVFPRHDWSCVARGTGVRDVLSRIWVFLIDVLVGSVSTQCQSQSSKHHSQTVD